MESKSVDTCPCDAPDDDARRHELIAQAAYFRAERRHFAPGKEYEDWLAAEAEIDQLPAGPLTRGA